MTVIIIALGAVIFTALALIVMNMPESKLLSESVFFKESVVIENADDIIARFTAGDYEGIRTGHCAGELLERLTDEACISAKEKLGGDWGAFVEVTKREGYEVTKKHETFALMQVTCKYENVTIKYTMLFDVNNKMAGFSIE